MSASDEAKKALEGVTPGPWCVEGDPWNQIVWSGLDNRVCFMAHSNGLDDDRDVATARFIAWAREGVPALLAEIAAKDAEIARLRGALRLLHDNVVTAFPTLADLGPVANARAALARVKWPTEYERKVAQIKEDFPNGI